MIGDSLLALSIRGFRSNNDRKPWTVICGCVYMIRDSRGIRRSLARYSVFTVKAKILTEHGVRYIKVVTARPICSLSCSTHFYQFEASSYISSEHSPPWQPYCPTSLPLFTPRWQTSQPQRTLKMRSVCSFSGQSVSFSPYWRHQSRSSKSIVSR